MAPANGSALHAPSPLPQQAQFPPGVPHLASSTSSPHPVQQPQLPPGVPVKAAAAERPPSAVPNRTGSANNAFPGSLSDLVTSFETVKQKGMYFHDRIRASY
jgi:CCR4-NOT transcription complex subunit 3